jgi:hypothetical protein
MQCFIGKASARFRTAVRFFQISTSSTSKSVDCMIGFQQCPHNHSYLHFIHFPNCDPFSFPGISRCYLEHATKHSFLFGICRVTQHVISFIYLHVHRRLIRAHPIDCCSAKELLRAIGWLAKKAVQENFVSFFTNTLST